LLLDKISETKYHQADLMELQMAALEKALAPDLALRELFLCSQPPFTHTQTSTITDKLITDI
jgi:hypothetical protein